MKDTSYKLFNESLEKYGINKLSNELGVNTGTINRWIELKSVPNSYYFDFCDLLDIEIDYSKHTYQEKDQFYTTEENANYCWKVLQNQLKVLGVDDTKYTYIEPAAGKGSFYNLLPQDRRIGIDIEPKQKGIIKQNYLSWKPTQNTDYIVIGNPPFGLRGNKALKFMNYSSEEINADFVAFILPQLFNSTGRGSCMKRVKGLNLIHSEIIDNTFVFPDDSNVVVNCIFQIWSKNHKIDIPTETCNQYIKIYSLSNGKTSGTKRNVDKLYDMDLYLPLTCFENDMKLYYDFDDLPLKRGYGIKILKRNKDIINIMKSTNWLEKSYQSTNGAYNLRTDIIQKVLTDNNIKDITIDNFV